MPAAAQGEGRVVYVVPIEGIIDLGLAPFVQRVLGEAEAAQARAVVLEINTFGGRVDVVSEGDLMEPGTPVEVVRVDGNRVVVRSITRNN